MLSESEASAFSTDYEKADSPAVPQNDLLTQSLTGEGQDEGATLQQKYMQEHPSKERVSDSAGPTMQRCSVEFFGNPKGQ